MNDVREFRSPYEAFRTSASRKPDTLFLAAPASAELPYARDGFALSYSTVAARVETLAAQYRAGGYGQGARVALLLESRPEFFEHWLALNALGASIVPINPDLRHDELSYQLHLSGVDVLVAADAHIPSLRKADLGAVRIVEHGGTIPAHAGRIARQSGEFRDEAALLFTSGSTGKPKGCMLSNRYFLQVADWFLTQGGVAAIGSDREINLTPLPMFHMNALGCSAVGMMAIGGTIVPLDRFHANRWWASVADSGATMVHCLGVIPAILLQLPPHEAEVRHAARFAFAPAVDVKHRATFEARYRLPIVDAWAMTETGGAAATTTAREPAGFPARCIGRPASGMEFRIVDDTGTDVQPGQPGEFLVRAEGADPRAGFFSGYLNDAVATDEAWDGGWFHTGDYIRAGDDGLLYFFDRKKSIVRRSGENIAVLEVESILHQLPSVGSTAVTPVPDDLRGEEVFAFVVKAPGISGNDADLAEAIARACALSLSYHKVPGYIAFVRDLPLSSTKKLARGDIKTMAAQAVADGAAFDLRALKAALRKAEASKA